MKLMERAYLCDTRTLDTFWDVFVFIANSLAQDRTSVSPQPHHRLRWCGASRDTEQGYTALSQEIPVREEAVEGWDEHRNCFGEDL